MSQIMDIDLKNEFPEVSEKSGTPVKQENNQSGTPMFRDDIIMIETKTGQASNVSEVESTKEDLTKTIDDKKVKNQRLRKERKVQKQVFEQDKQILNHNKIKDTAKRFQFLLGHSELFSHFIDLKKSKDQEFRQLVEETEKFRNSFNEDSGSKRHRRTEKEEDEELLNDEADESQDVTRVFNKSPSYIKNGIMRDYQLQGLNWMISLFENGINGILADEMGLGKTLQTISFLGYLKHFRGTPGPHLVVAPKSTLNNWAKEFNMWMPDFHIIVLHGTKEERTQLITDRMMPKDFQVCITSYEMCLIEKATLKKFAFQYIIIDEAHRIKNENSMLSQIVRLFKSRNRLLITGTPLQNNLHELWALLNFLLPDVFSSSEDFDSWFSSQGGDQDSVIQQLHKVLRPFLLRRIKSDVEKSLLPKKEINLYVGMTSLQRKWYQRILEKDIAAVNGAVSKSESKTRLLNIVMQLRKCCNHPYLFDGAEPGPPYTTDEHIIENAGKMVVLDKLLKRLKAQGSRVLLFSQMSRVLDILEDYCIFRENEYCRIDGQTKQDDRITAIDEFNAPESSKFIFLLTTRAGGLGINLTTADIVILYDSDWNPQVDLQAQDRAHRIGQTKQVYVFRFVTENAIEEKVLERAAQKLRLDQLVIQQGRLVQSQKAASKEELLTMIQHGAESIFSSSDSTVTDDDIDLILRKGEEKTVELNMKYQSLGLDDLQNFTSESAYQWQGEDWSNQNSRFNWIEPPKRERKVNYAVDSYYREALRVTAKPTQPKKLAGYKVSEGDNVNNTEFREQERQDEQDKIDNAEALTEKEESEKEALMENIFEDWSKRDFNNFVNASAKYGRNALEEIASEIEGKTFEEVKAYTKVFWQRYQELPNHEEIVAKVIKGESKLQQTHGIQELLKAKVAQYRTPGHQLQVSNQAKGKTLFTEEEDRYLLISLAKYGYGTEDVYEKIRNDIENSDLFRFNWFIKSRTSGEIARRCTTLINLIQKEHEEDQQKQPQEEKKRKAIGDQFIISNGVNPPKRSRRS
ncbi:7889_t:CDS:10 [Diversispora eburnea]|uniref:7889_t:CDS:1 n=1 Tax=Diversispora eburnea TaxID=1213867 RepID=A0A9N8WH44_9GLOM|nr:7889_t:CDS:10 [Diversispora eburnea]